jgi:hypothetical protein
VNTKSDKLLRKKLLVRAADDLKKAAEYAVKNDLTWATIYARGALRLIEAANAIG